MGLLLALNQLLCQYCILLRVFRPAVSVLVVADALLLVVADAILVDEIVLRVSLPFLGRRP